MICILNHKNKDVSSKIRAVFQVSYAVEAKLLNAIDFPPLKRPLESFINSSNSFFGFYKNDKVAGVIEINSNSTSTHIQSLVVDPHFFRQGIAKNLMEFVLNKFNAKMFTVETGVKNKPATQLYKKFGFIEVKQWNTDHGVRKIRFEKK